MMKIALLFLLAPSFLFGAAAGAFLPLQAAPRFAANKVALAAAKDAGAEAAVSDSVDEKVSREN